jgi:hypothetical protein
MKAFLTRLERFEADFERDMKTNLSHYGDQNEFIRNLATAIVHLKATIALRAMRSGKQR